MSIAEAYAVAESGFIVAEQGGNAIVPWWSYTKTVIATAALTLARDGKLDLDERVGSRSYTLRQLLQHRAGVPEYGALPEYHAAVAAGSTPWPAAELLHRVHAERLLFEPGHGWLYSNVGYLLVRQLIEEAGGANLNGIMQERVLQPLGIRDVSIAETPADLVGVMMGEAVGYDPGWVYHGLLAGPLREAALLLDRLLSGTLLPLELVRQMLDGHRLTGPIPDRPWQEPGYGLGLMVGHTPHDGLIAGHTGGGPGSVIAVYRLCDHRPIRTGAAFLPGSDPGSVERSAIAHGSSKARCDQGSSSVSQ